MMALLNIRHKPVQVGKTLCLHEDDGQDLLADIMNSEF
jgi:hypothetical protein